MSDKYRFNIQLEAGGKKHLQSVQKKLGETSLIGMFRKSIAIAEMLADHHLAGGKIILQDKKGKQETVKCF